MSFQPVIASTAKQSRGAIAQSFTRRDCFATLAMTLSMKIKIFAVGGTIDKVYFDKKSTYEVGPPNIAIILRDLNLNFEYAIEPLLRKDSLDMTEADRQLIVSRVASDPHQQIIITHGTDTMIETAKQLEKICGKVIVLTGAMEPAMFKTSDAVFNIGCAVAAVQTLAPGVYITMNGRIFNPHRVRKDLETGRFEAI